MVRYHLNRRVRAPLEETEQRERLTCAHEGYKNTNPAFVGGGKGLHWGVKPDQQGSHMEGLLW